MTPCDGFAPPERLAARLRHVRRELAARRLDAFVVTAPAHLVYLLNVRASAGAAVVEPAALHLVIDFRYREAVRQLQRRGIAPPDLQVVLVEESSDETVSRLLQRLAPARVGVEADHLSVRRWTWLRQALEAELAPTVDLVEGARLVKDGWEIDTLRTAGAMLAAAVAPACRCAVRGRTEIDVARAIARVIDDAGFERPAFDAIVASGPNGALPHAHPTDRRLADGDLVVIDFGGVHRGYCVDVSRTVAVGAAPPAARRIHRAVREAQAAALAAAAPGRRASEVDAAARAVLDRYGLADRFGHATGHGLGLEVHELPRIGRPRTAPSAPDDRRLAPGMVFTVEPGVYVPEIGGVRIEDDVLVTGAGIEVLTPAGRGLTVG